MEGIPELFVALYAFVVGTIVGSFSNVVIHRVPIGASIVSPPSACPSCGAQIRWFENIPVFSWAVLRGRCRSCRSRISARYPLVEILVGLLWAGMVMRFSLSPELPAFLAFGTVLVILSAIDLEHRRIPNKILGPAMALAVVLLVVASLVGAEFGPLTGAGAGAIGYFLPMLIIGLASPKGMGFGDIKFSAYLGLHLGWLSPVLVFVGAFLGFFLGATIGLAAIAFKGRSRKDFIPFGPSMAAGALIALFVGDRILLAWLG